MTIQMEVDALHPAPGRAAIDRRRAGRHLHDLAGGARRRRAPRRGRGAADRRRRGHPPAGATCPIANRPTVRDPFGSRIVKIPLAALPGLTAAPSTLVALKHRREPGIQALLDSYLTAFLEQAAAPLGRRRRAGGSRRWPSSRSRPGARATPATRRASARSARACWRRRTASWSAACTGPTSRPPRVAASLGISVRTLHLVFEPGGESFCPAPDGATPRSAPTRCSQPRPTMAVTEVAYASGFGQPLDLLPLLPGGLRRLARRAAHGPGADAHLVIFAVVNVAPAGTARARTRPPVAAHAGIAVRPQLKRHRPGASGGSGRAIRTDRIPSRAGGAARPRLRQDHPARPTPRSGLRAPPRTPRDGPSRTEGRTRAERLAPRDQAVSRRERPPSRHGPGCRTRPPDAPCRAPFRRYCIGAAAPRRLSARNGGSRCAQTQVPAGSVSVQPSAHEDHRGERRQRQREGVALPVAGRRVAVPAAHVAQVRSAVDAGVRVEGLAIEARLGHARCGSPRAAPA